MSVLSSSNFANKRKAVSHRLIGMLSLGIILYFPRHISNIHHRWRNHLRSHAASKRGQRTGWPRSLFHSDIQTQSLREITALWGSNGFEALEGGEDYNRQVSPTLPCYLHPDQPDCRARVEGLCSFQ